MTIQLPENVSYNAFIEDLSERVAEKIMKAAKEPEFINQRTAYRMFGRANVDRWRRTGKVQPFKRPGVVEYRTTDLRRLQNTVQDYLIR